ncbi:myelin regulatory factor-like protein [Epinephelus moara]|uniref:myelin regulatory factor-like protein n=1 Tax=Epinephelus moara TaxID=300413 RepID=UPI00214F17AD|nr:myelin regulatory factor-like protein [Epinephelus moara]XP_049893807.1 myelin regulatory factor-like protein [Epinephelus moara]XP_049893808.1 myelin regulatory factor-like protein [Epinephelus moara]XP_049893809.1 myelin regulatory factor-like protein [Epinephelus moara]XP_049893811.1 myelin regulatory factor-like protein [Epinephelus moara]
MDPRAGRLPLQVLGENEALQQFFSGQDVSGVLDSSVAVDTSILEQYLSNDMDPNSFMLPESPPDSSSEACSPPQIPDFHYEAPYWSNQQNTQEVFQPTQRSAPSSSCRFKNRGPVPAHNELLTHEQLHSLGLTNTYIKSGTSPAPPPPPAPLHQQTHQVSAPPAPLQQHTHHLPEHTHYLSPESCLQAYTPPTPPSPPVPPSNSYATPCTVPGVVPHVSTPPSTCQLGSASTLHICSSESRKRRRSESESEEPSTGIKASCNESDATQGSSVGNGVGGLGSYQLLTWEQYRPEHWSTLYDSSYQTMSPPAYHVDTDKGFNYSAGDEAFVCQKKNHFQVTVHIGVAAEPQYVRTLSGPQQVDHFLIKVFGIKLESPSHQVTIEQSQPDRSKKPFHPVRVSLPSGKITKVTLGRLHFSETTSNNMRKKGKPNPDQRYFQMVVGLYASVGGDETFLLTALVSERIIIRASNPGQFETDGDALWQRGAMQDAVVCQGRVGINTDSPDEALVVCGNAKVMGAVMQPSDRRAKENIQEVDSEQQLKRITQMRLVEFDYKPEFASVMGIDHTHQTGIIAQEVKELLPSAVMEVGDVSCSDGETIENFLMVDKEQIFMENVGAVQQLSKLTDNLDTRIKELEVWSGRLAKLKCLTGSLRSTGIPRKASSVSMTPGPDTCKTGKVQKEGWSQKYSSCLQHKVFQASVFTLLATMAFCVISITALYLLNLREDDYNIFPGISNGSVVPPQTTAWSSTVQPSTPHGPWPPDMDFCDLLYCEQVYCCTPPAGGSTDPNITSTESPAEENSDIAEERREKLYQKLKNAKDWTNTTLQSLMIKENQQVIDSKYCLRDECGPGRYTFRVPISQFVPDNMRVTLVMNSTEVLVVHLCSLDESTACSAMLDIDTVTGSRYPSNTQGEHEWPLHVARLYHSSYHFRSTVAGQADCSTDYYYAGARFTDYYFHFYRRCTHT